MPRELTTAKAKQELRRERKTADMVRFVGLLEEIGPDINEIARRMNLFKETVRYWYKKKLIGNGYSILGNAAHLKLGLKRLVIVARVDVAHRSIVQELFVDMDGLWYVVGFSRTMPDDMLVIHASVPDEHVSEFMGLMNDIKSRLGFFTDIEFFPSDWVQRAHMRAEYHDFDSGRWEFDWKQVASMEASEKLPRAQTREQFDAEDLMLVRELQVNAARPLSKIAEAMNMPYKRVLRHYRHVVDKGLISGYRLVWTKTRYISDERKLITRKHSYMFCSVIVKDVKEAELVKLTSGVEKVPFLWATCGGKHFLAEFFLPMDATHETLIYLRELLTPFAGRMRFFVTDWHDTLAFSIPVDIYDREQRRWTFDRKKTLGEFESNLDRLRGRVAAHRKEDPQRPGGAR